MGERGGRLTAGDVRRVVAAALVGTALAVFVTVSVTIRTGGIVDLVSPGAAGPSALVIAHDFPGVSLPHGGGHDGQQYYAVARQPMHWAAAARSLDRPRYRLQRALFPWLAWSLHPEGGGPGLIIAMVVVQALGLAVGGFALGAIAVRAGRSALWAVAFPLLPGSLASLRIGTSDGLAVGLLLGCFAAVSARRHALAVICAIAAVMTKEVVLLLLVAAAIRRQGYRTAALAAAIAAGCWYLALREDMPATGERVVEFARPLRGLSVAVHWWASGHDFGAAAATVVTGLLVVVALRRRGLWNPLGQSIAAFAAFVLILSRDTLSFDYNATRTLLPLLSLTIASLLSIGPGGARRSRAPTSDEAYPDQLAPIELPTVLNFDDAL